uniref:Secreted protein n=1 Tax=Rhipicephalus zambeziensis TaxID=60191 RepID=A0A224Y6L8_9ACAR
MCAACVIPVLYLMHLQTFVGEVTLNRNWQSILTAQAFHTDGQTAKLECAAPVFITTVQAHPATVRGNQSRFVGGPLLGRRPNFKMSAEEPLQRMHACASNEIRTVFTEQKGILERNFVCHDNGERHVLQMFRQFMTTCNATARNHTFLRKSAHI